MRSLIIDIKKIIFAHDHCQIKINYKKVKISSISPTGSDLVKGFHHSSKGHTFIYFSMFYPDRIN